MSLLVIMVIVAALVIFVFMLTRITPERADKIVKKIEELKETANNNQTDDILDQGRRSRQKSDNFYYYNPANKSIPGNAHNPLYRLNNRDKH